MSTKLQKLIDEYGILDARLDELNARREEVRKELDKSGAVDVEGELFNGTVTRFKQDVVAWKEVAVKAGASRQLIAAHTTRDVPKLRISVKPREAAIANLEGYRRHAGGAS